VSGSRAERFVRRAYGRRQDWVFVLGLLSTVVLCRFAAGSEPINPIAAPVRIEPVARWDFRGSGGAATADPTADSPTPGHPPRESPPGKPAVRNPRPAQTLGWQAAHACRLKRLPDALEVTCTGDDPYFIRPVDLPGGPMVLRMRAAGRGLAGPGTIYWSTRESPQMGEDKVARLPARHDGQWHVVETRFRAPGTLNALRIDPAAGVEGASGRLLIEWIELEREVPCPVQIEYVETVRVADDKDGNAAARFHLHNIAEQPITLSIAQGPITLAPDERRAVDVLAPGRRALETVRLAAEVPGFGPLERTVFVFHPEVAERWVERTGEGFKLLAAPDGSLVRIERQRRLLAVLGPLVQVDQQPVRLRLDESAQGADRFVFRGTDGQADRRVELRIKGRTVEVTIDWGGPCEGPVVRCFGPLEQGLLAGVEYLGRGERSSSKLDIETPEHLRFAPDPSQVTMPLMAFVTQRGSVAVHWDVMALQPVFATPNFFDGSDDHRMSLRREGKGGVVRASILISDQPLDEAILWAVDRSSGLPRVPDPPRDPEAQRRLCLAALSGPLRTEEGWGHCVEQRWQRRPFADMASSWWRLSGRVPELIEPRADHPPGRPTGARRPAGVGGNHQPIAAAATKQRLVPGGAHIPNPAIYFVTGGAEEWLAWRRRAIEGIIARQEPDGSFRYNGPMREGHFENTASGHCGRPAAELLEFAWQTGDQRSLEAGLRALEFIKRFRTPRGAQVWEIPLHTPDILASAWCVWAYVRGYELTGRGDYLAEARRWAVRGVPFVYLWGRYPVMVYATIPVLGATNRRAPNWIGLPVQWCGLNYAYALTKLAPYDRALDWQRLARGILVAGQQMQYPDGPLAGLLPDSFVLKTQQRRPWNINPCALVSVELALEGKPDGLAVATGAGHRIAAPFPVKIEGDQAVITAPRGASYQVLIDGKRIVELRSSGRDTVALGSGAVSSK